MTSTEMAEAILMPFKYLGLDQKRYKKVDVEKAFFAVIRKDQITKNV